MATEQMAPNGNTWTWTRRSDYIDSLAVKGLTFRVVDDQMQHVRIDGASARGTDTFVLTNEDCVEPEEPTFDDLPGKANDTLTVPTTTGVVYSPKSGTQPGKGTVTVTATAARGYRLADEDGTPIPLSQTRWTHTFDPNRTVAVPDTAVPTFKLAEPAEPGAKSTKPNPNVVVVTAVDGITWIVDGKPVKADAKTPLVEVPIGTKTKVVVTATPVDRETVLEGRTTWTVTEATRMPLPKKPAIIAPLHEAGIGRRSVVRWAPPYLSKDRFTYDVQFRTAPTRNAWGEEIPTTWKPWLAGTKALSANLSGLPGGVYQVRISARRAGIEATPWTSPTTVYVPLDVTSGPRGWVRTPDKTAIGGTLVGTTRAGASWSVRTAKTDKVLLWFATGPLGAKARVYVDGRPAALINTYAPKGRSRVMIKAVPVRWGAHTVKVVDVPTGKRNLLRLDGIAYGR